MQLICESPHLEDYLSEDEIVNYTHPLIQQAVQRLRSASDDETALVRRTFEFVRDTIPHSVDAQRREVTYIASDVLSLQTGLCYAKSHLLAALLRAQGIPTGLCYQSLLFGDTPDTGYVLHGLNAVYLRSLARWIRLDPRGNKPGVHSEFSLDAEKLAFQVQPELGEIDYPTVYLHPHPTVIEVLRSHTDCLQMCEKALPARLQAHSSARQANAASTAEGGW